MEDLNKINVGLSLNLNEDEEDGDGDGDDEQGKLKEGDHKLKNHKITMTRLISEQIKNYPAIYTARNRFRFSHQFE